MVIKITDAKGKWGELSPYSIKMPIKLHGFEFRYLFNLYSALRINNANIQLLIYNYDNPKSTFEILNSADTKKYIRRDWSQETKIEVLFFLLRLKLAWHYTDLSQLLDQLLDLEPTEIIYDGPRLDGYEEALVRFLQYYAEWRGNKTVLTYVREPEVIDLYMVRESTKVLEVVGEHMVSEEGLLGREAVRQLRQQKKINAKLITKEKERKFEVFLDQLNHLMKESISDIEELIQNVVQDYNVELEEPLDLPWVEYPRIIQQERYTDKLGNAISFFKSFHESVDKNKEIGRLQEGGRVIYQLISSKER